MGRGRYLVESHLREGRSVSELARTHGIHRSWLYKLIARYRAGDTELEPRSRRPRRSPTAMSSTMAQRIVRVRAELLAAGLDGGAESIQARLARRSRTAPSTSSIWRLLRRRGLVVPQPHKRPRSSYLRFEASLPNECWQADATHWTLTRGRGCEIVNVIDDHSRRLLASVALAVTTGSAVAAIFRATAHNYGLPAAVLTDNGRVFTTEDRGWRVALESELERGGITHKHARPYHPQTCGKVERLHQTMKRYLAQRPPAPTLALLQTQLDQFRVLYNERRPHRALARKTPAEVYRSKVKATPLPRPALPTHYRVRRDQVDAHGKLSLRFDSRLHHIGVGAAHKHERVVLLIADRDVRVLTRQGKLLRHLTLDPKRDYQRQGVAV